MLKETPKETLKETLKFGENSKKVERRRKKGKKKSALVYKSADLDRLPGDLVFKRGGVTVYFPIGLMILLSVIGTIVLNLFFRR